MAAGRIVTLGRTGADVVRALLYYDIPEGTRKTYGTSGNPVVPSPSADLDTAALEGLTAAERAALDAGEAFAREWRVRGCAGLVDQALLDRLRAEHSDLAARLLAEFEETYDHAGHAWDSEA